MTENYKDKEWMYNKYEKEKLSTYQIAKLCEVGKTSINRWLTRLEIAKRSTSESTHLAICNHSNISQKAREWICGELLGDGCLQTRSSRSAVFQYGSKYLEYTEYIRDTLKSFGINQAGKIYKRHHKELNYYSYSYCSRSYIELLKIYKRWYPKVKKIVPKNIVLTSLTCRQWYIGDGSLVRHKRGKPYIVLATNGFSILSVKQLVKQLRELGFGATRRPSVNTINISTRSTKEFLNYIGESPTNCYRYKFAY